MENRLIYKTGNGPETVSESGKFSGDGEKEFLEIKGKIESFDKSDITPRNLEKVVNVIGKLYKNLSMSEEGMIVAYRKGEFFKDLYALIRDKWGLEKIAGKSAGENGPITVDLAKLFCFFADPDKAAADFIDKLPDHVAEADIMKLAEMVMRAANTYVSSNLKNYTRYVRKCLGALYDRYDDPFGKKLPSSLEPTFSVPVPKPDTSKISEVSAMFRTWLVYQKDNFEFEILESLDWLGEAGRKELNKQAAYFYISGKNGAYNESPESFDESIKSLGTIENSTAVNTVLARAGLYVIGSTDRNDRLFYARPRIYLMLAWSFYKGLLFNPNANDKQRQKAYENHNEVFKTYPELGFTPDLVAKRAEVASETADEATGEDLTIQIVPDVNLGNPPHPEAQKLLSEIRAGEKKFNSLKDSIYLSLDGEGAAVDDEDLLNTILELKAKIKKLYGIDQIVALNAKATIDLMKAAEAYFENFGLALQNARKLPKYKAKLDKMESLAGEQYAAHAGELQAMLADLKAMNLFPPEAVKIHKTLLAQADKLYTELALPPKIDVSRAPKIEGAGEESDFYDEDNLNEYVYSPMLDVADEGQESFEMPEIMHVQVNRIRVIQSLVESLDAGNSMSADEMTGHLDNVLEETMDYYMGDKYDGVTPFDLDAKLKSFPRFGEFVSDFKRLIEMGLGKQDVFINSSAATVYNQKTKLTAYLSDKFDLSIREVDDKVREWKENASYTSELLQVLSGDANVDIGTIKKAGSAVAMFQRRVLKNYFAARSLMVKLLELQLAGARKAAEEDRNLTVELRHKASYNARMQTFDYMQANPDLESKIKNGIRVAFAKMNNGAEMPANLLRKKYDELYDAIMGAQKVMLYDMYLNWASTSTKFMNPDKLADPVDKAVLAEFYKSVDPDGGWTDEKNDTWSGIKSGLCHMAVDIALIFVSGGTAVMVSTSLKKLWEGSRAAKWLLETWRFKKVGKILFHAARSTIEIGSEAAIFAQMYPWMAEKVFGKDQTTLIEAFQKGFSEGLRKLAGEMAMFGAFHGMSWLRSFMRRGGAGKSLMAEGLKNPKAIPEIAEVLKIAEMDSAKAMEALKAFTPKIKNPQVKQIAEDYVSSINLLKEQYTRLVEGIPERFVKTKKLVQFMVMDLHFDAAAMLIGGLVKQGIYDEQKAGEAEATIADTIKQAYGGALAFRGAFTVVKSGGKWVKDVWNNNSVAEGVPEIRAAIEGVEVKIRKIDAAFESQTVAMRGTDGRMREVTVSELRSEAKRLRSKADLVDDQIRAARTPGIKGKRKRPDTKIPRGLRSQATAIETQIKAMEAKLTEAKAPFERYKAEMQAREEAMMAQLTGERKLGDFAVPSRIARFLPKRLIRQLYKDYQVNGEFVGSDGLTKMLLSDFPAALKMIEGAKRSLLSVNQILVVSSRLNGEQCLKFLEAQGKIMTRREKIYFLRMVETMGISKESIPEWVDNVGFIEGSEKPSQPDGTPRGNRSSLGEGAALVLNRTRESRWRMILVKTLVGAASALELLTGSGAKPPVERPNPALIVKVKAADLQSGGNGRFYIPEKGEGGFEAMPKATKKSQVVLIDAKGAETGDVNMVREWNAKTGFDFLAQDQKSIFEGMKGAGIPEGAMVGMTQLYENLPDIMKNHVRMFAVADKTGEVREYYAIDQEGFEKEMRALMPQIEAEMRENFQVLVDAGLLDKVPDMSNVLKADFGASALVLLLIGLAKNSGKYFKNLFTSLDLSNFLYKPKDNAAFSLLASWYALFLLGPMAVKAFTGYDVLWVSKISNFLPHNLKLYGFHDFPIGLALIIPLILYRSRKTWDLLGLRGKGEIPSEAAKSPKTPTEGGTAPEGGEKKIPGVHLPKEQVPAFTDTFVSTSYSELGIKAPSIPLAIGNRLNSTVKAALKDTHTKLTDLFTNHLKFAPEKLTEAQSHFRNLFKLQQASLIEAECSKVLKDTTVTLTPEHRTALEGIRDQAAAARTKLIGEIFGKQDFVNQIHELDLNGQMKFNNYIGEIFVTSLRSRAFDKGEMNAAWETELARLEKDNPEEVSNFAKRILAKRNFEKNWKDSHFTEKEIAQIEKGFKDLSAVLAENPGALEALAQIAAIRAQLKALKPEYVKAKRRVEIAKKNSRSPETKDLETMKNYDTLKKGIEDAKSRLKGIREIFKGLDPKVKMAIFGAVGLAIGGGIWYLASRPKSAEPEKEKTAGEKLDAADIKALEGEAKAANDRMGKADTKNAKGKFSPYNRRNH